MDPQDLIIDKKNVDARMLSLFLNGPSTNHAPYEYVDPDPYYRGPITRQFLAIFGLCRQRKLIAFFELATLHASFPDFFASFRHYALLGYNYCSHITETGFAQVVLGLSQDKVCTGLFENFSVNSLKQDLSNDATFNPPLFSLVSTFNINVGIVVVVFRFYPGQLSRSGAA
jgi:hypothetical protein